jgi:RNA-dependent RNA polymerase
VIQIPDVRRNGLCFTDGIGRISPDLAAKVASFLPGVNTPPCAFQIRFGGCKGMVAVYPPWEGKDLLGLRKSMEKFACAHMQLEVISWPTAHQPAFLSRQLIQLLEARGIGPRALGALQEEHLRTFDAVMIAGQGPAPLARLRALVGDHSPAFSVLEPALAQLAAAPRGTEPALAPFQLCVLEKAREHHLKELRDRAHVFVPDGALLLGCTDEQRLLRPGQVFVRLSSPSKVITGLVMVYRNPGLNPRDLGVLRAVDCPELHHLEGVVVFSQLGERPEPGNLSGGDLERFSTFCAAVYENAIWNEKNSTTAYLTSLIR